MSGPTEDWRDRQCTPQRAIMQARFLNRDWCSGLTRQIWDLDKFEVAIVGAQFERDGTDLDFVAKVRSTEGSPKPAELRRRRGGWIAAHDESWMLVKVALAPLLADSYPTHLRRCLADDCNVLVVGSYAGSLGLDQVRDIFVASGVELVLETEIEATIMVRTTS